jgi:hypothetical protein
MLLHSTAVLNPDPSSEVVVIVNLADIAKAEHLPK